MVHDGCNYFSFRAIFCPFTRDSPKNQNLRKTEKKKKKPGESSFYTSVPKIMTTCYSVPEIWCMTNVIVTFHFGLFLCLLPP